MRVALLTATLLFAASDWAGAQSDSRPGQPPSAEFSRYEKKVPWRISRELVERLSARNPGINFDEARVRAYTLPDLFTLESGEKVVTAAVWEQRRRGELIELFRQVLYGYAPPRPESLSFRVIETDPRAMAGKATRKRVVIGFQLQQQPFTFRLTLFVPNQGGGKAPVFLLLNHREAGAADPAPENPPEFRRVFWPPEYLIARGYAAAAIHVSAEVEPDRPDATTGIRAFYRQHYARANELTWGAIGAWAWAGMRAMDYFETDPDINPAQVAVIGHSRGGKTALWTGAQDTRFALICNNCGGRSGPGIMRRNIGKGIDRAASEFPHWFAPRYKTYGDNVDALPVDGHEMVALVAPRGYHDTEGAEDLWADPRGAWLTFIEAAKVWALYGKAKVMKDEMPLVNDLLINGPMAFHMREGGHDLTLFDWKLYLDQADLLFQHGTK